MAKGTFPCDVHPESTATPKGRCRACNREYQNRWYRQNKELHGVRTKKANDKARALAKEWLWGYLQNHPCVDCGEVDPIVLQFDHVRGVKKYGIANMVSGGYCLDTIKLEVAKCDIRCANCHTRRTASQLGWWRSLHEHRESSG